MTIGFLKASRRLWARRLKYRKAQLVKAEAARDGARIAKWKRLIGVAAQRVRHRDAQIQAKNHATHVSRAGVNLVADFEGFVDHVYHDSVGVETIGYGETRRDIINRYRNSRIPRSVALRLLRERLDHDYAEPVRELGVPLTQNQFDALASFAYNLGPGPLGAGHSLGDALRKRDYRAAADAFLLYDQAGGHVLPGLATRRRAERALFLKG